MVDETAVFVTLRLEHGTNFIYFWKTCTFGIDRKKKENLLRICNVMIDRIGNENGICFTDREAGAGTDDVLVLDLVRGPEAGTGIADAPTVAARAVRDRTARVREESHAPVASRPTDRRTAAPSPGNFYFYL